MKLSEAKKKMARKIILYGPPKTGKTLLAASLAESMNVTLFDLEKSHKVLLTENFKFADRINLIDIPDTRSFPIGIETMLAVFKRNPTSLATPYTPRPICNLHGKVSCLVCKKQFDGADEGTYSSIVNLNELTNNDVVIIDSFTQLANSAMAHITRGLDDMAKPEWDHYAKQGFIMDKLLSEIQAAPFNVVCITHELEVEFEDGKKKIVPVAGTSSFSRNTGKYFDEVVYVEVKNKKHVIGTTTSYANNILTGSRTGMNFDGKENISLLEFFK